MKKPTGNPPPDTLGDSVRALLQTVEKEAERLRAAVEGALPKHRASAENLAHYLGLRRQDLRRLQLDLAARGLSSLGRCEGNVRDTLTRLHGWLTGPRGAAPGGADNALTRSAAESLLHANTRALLGPRPSDRHVYIMVTAPDAAHATAEWADSILEAGGNVLRINGAHETDREWAVVASIFKSRAASLGKSCRVFVDLPGPKLRTDILQLDDAVIHLPRRKDRMGRTVAPTPVLLTPEYRGGATVPVPAEWIARLRAGDRIGLRDAAGRSRMLAIRDSAADGVLAHCDRSLYITSGLPLTWRRGGKIMGEGSVGPLPAQPREIRLAPNDVFLLNDSGLSEDPAIPALAFPEPVLLAQVRPGERVILDDGRTVAVAEAAVPGGVLCRVRHTLKSGGRIGTGKGIAFPDSELALGSLGPQDEMALRFALEHADGIGVSFVNSPGDVAVVVERLRKSAKPGFGMILKLETRGAMRNLAGILFEALRYDPVGLMIARGDLAVEVSFERLAEMQEELLWFGEACHLPVIWATQVLDSVAHSGLPTRAEVTDAAMAMRAECVMLNRGPYITTAVRMLGDIIRKMETHQYKKRALYRPLSIARPR